jgi:hypothetical protein
MKRQQGKSRKFKPMQPKGNRQSQRLKEKRNKDNNNSPETRSNSPAAPVDHEPTPSPSSPRLPIFETPRQSASHRRSRSRIRRPPGVSETALQSIQRTPTHKGPEIKTTSPLSPDTQRLLLVAESEISEFVNSGCIEALHSSMSSVLSYMSVFQKDWQDFVDWLSTEIYFEGNSELRNEIYNISGFAECIHNSVKSPFIGFSLHIFNKSLLDVKPAFEKLGSVIRTGITHNTSHTQMFYIYTR